MPDRPRVYRSARGSTRATGLIIAALLACASVSVLGYYFYRGRHNAGPRPADLFPTDNQAPPKLVPRPIIAGTKSTTPASGGKGIKAQVASRSDPTRLAAYILSQSLEPLEASRYHAELPQAFLYLKDGRTVHIRSDTAKFVLPQGPGGQPDSGVLDGNVVISVFDRKLNGAEIDPGKDSPSLKLTTTTLTFDITAGQFTGPERFVVQGTGIDYAGTGLNILYNQKDERLELLTIAQSEPLHLKPKAPAPRESTAAPRASSIATTEIALTEHRTGSPTSAAGPALGPGTASPDTAAPSSATRSAAPSPTPSTKPHALPETFYHATFAQDASVVQGDRSVRGDDMAMWIRLVDNHLAPNAIASTTTARGQAGTDISPRAEAPAPQFPSPEVVLVPEPGAPPTNDTPARSQSSEEVVVTWLGPLEVRPLAARPAELEANEIAVRFTSTGASTVAFRDAASGAVGTSRTLEYRATSRDIILASPDRAGVALTLPNVGDVHSQHLAVNLNTGIASIKSEGELVGRGKGTGLALAGGEDLVGPPAPVDSPDAANAQASKPLNTRAVTWNDQGDFQFLVANGTMTGVLLNATLAGDVRGIDRGATLSADWINAEFTQTAPDASRGLVAPDPLQHDRSLKKIAPSTLAHLTAKDHVVGTDGQGGVITTDRLDVAFESRAGNPKASDPVLLTMTGSATASRKDSHLAGDLIEARLSKRGDIADAAKTEPTITVSELLARHNVRYTRDDGVRATGDELRAVTATQLAELLGDNASIGKDESTVHGSQIQLDGNNRRMEVFGAGRFDLSDAAPKPGDVKSGSRGTGNASWARGMTFDDRSGILECRGDVVGEMNPDASTERKFFGERLRLEITPGSPDPSIQDSISPAATASPSVAARAERRLLRADVFGSVDDRENGVNASAQSTTFEPTDIESDDPNQTRRMIGLQYLEGPIIRADDALGTVRVPAAGKMLIADRRPSASSGSSAARPEPVGGGNELATRGDALFTWQGDFIADRNAGTATLRRGVRVTHQPPGATTPTELESEEVVAYVRDDRTSAAEVPGLTPDAATPARELRVRLLRATANGAVWARYAGKELTADTLDYNAAIRLLTAAGSSNNDVVLFDPSKPTPITAKLLEWDMARDRIDVKKPGTIVVPADLVKGR